MKIFIYSLLALISVVIFFQYYIFSLGLIILLIYLIFNNKIIFNKKDLLFLMLIVITFSFRSYISIVNNHTTLENKTGNFSLEVVDKLEINGDYLKTFGYINNEKVIVNYKLDNEKEKEYFKNNFLGGTLESRGVIEDISLPKNYYQFNFKKYNEDKQIYKKYTILNIYKIDKNIKNNYLKLVNIKNNIVKNSTQNLLSNKKGYIEALIFGERSNIEKEDLDIFKNLGIIHLLAISGLHIGILMFIVYKFLDLFKVSKEIKNLLILIILPLYSFIVGFSSSVMRASLMIMIFLLLKKMKIDSLGSICITFSLMLFYNPYYIKDIGFIYSFSITFCLLLSNDFINSINQKIKQVFKVSLIAFLSSIPINISYFYSINIGSIISNVIIVPYFTIIIFPFVLFSYLFYCINEYFYYFLIEPILNFLFYILDKLLEIAKIFSFKINIGNLNYIYIYIITLLSIFLLLLLNKKQYKQFFLISLAFILLIYTLKYVSNKNVAEKIIISNKEVYFLRDNSNTLLVNTSDNLHFNYKDYRKKEKNYDIINEYENLLSYEGISKFENLLLTLKSSKSVGFASILIAKNKIKKLIIIEDIIYNEKILEIINIAKFKNINIKILKQNEIYYFSNFTLENKKDKVNISNKNKNYEISKDI